MIQNIVSFISWKKTRVLSSIFVMKEHNCFYTLNRKTPAATRCTRTFPSSNHARDQAIPEASLIPLLSQQGAVAYKMYGTRKEYKVRTVLLAVTRHVLIISVLITIGDRKGGRRPILASLQSRYTDGRSCRDRGNLVPPW